MYTIETIALLGAPMLLFVVFLFALSTHSKMLGQNGTTEETRRSWEGSWLILLDFLLILLILVWRVL